jgi:Uma2 family endonuclease
MEMLAKVALDADREYEIVNGQPEEKEMAGARHGGVGTRLIIRLGGFVEDNNLGGVYGPDTTFKIGMNERLPDISFVAAARIPEDGEPEGIWPIAPDLAVEIISPNDFWEKVSDKISDYFAAGVRQVWLVAPKDKTVTIYHSPFQVTILTEEDELTCEELLPGFRCRLRDIFRSPARRA